MSRIIAWLALALLALGIFYRWNNSKYEPYYAVGRFVNVIPGVALDTMTGRYCQPYDSMVVDEHYADHNGLLDCKTISFTHPQ